MGKKLIEVALPQHAVQAGSVTRRWSVGEFNVANDAAGRDLKALTDLGLLTQEGERPRGALRPASRLPIDR